jgi:hypothetical protein
MTQPTPRLRLEFFVDFTSRPGGASLVLLVDALTAVALLNPDSLAVSWTTTFPLAATLDDTPPPEVQSEHG